MNKRDLRLDKYNISSKRYKELCGFCEQYPEWKRELLNFSIIKSPVITDMPTSPIHNSDNTGNIALKRVEYERKCTLIEEAAKEASREFADYLIKAVCYEVSVNYLITHEEMYICKSQFYILRRRFFCILDKMKK